MAKQKKEDNNENKKKKKGGKGLLIAILVPIIIIVLIAGLFLAIIEGILGIILDFIKGLLEFFSDPIGWFSEAFRAIGNWFKSWLGGSYSPPEPAVAYMGVYVDDDTVGEIRNGVEDIAIDTKKTGLTDSMLKKVILAYYTTYATVDTFIYTPINDLEDMKEIIIPGVYWSIESAMNDINNNYIYFYGYGDDFKGENGQLYMATKGIIKPINANGKKMKYYDMETFLSVAAEFENAIENDYNSDYISSFFNTFSEIYTVAEGATGSITVIRGDTQGFGNGKYTETRTLDYREKVSVYAMPIELPLNMLDITASPDFIEAVCNLVQNSSIVINVCQTKTTEITIDDVTYTLVDNSGVNEDADKKHSISSGYTSSDAILTLNSVDCWYCRAKFDTQMNITNIGPETEDITENYDFEKIVRLYDWVDPNDYSIINKNAQRTTIGSIVSYTETTGTHEENIQPFLDILKTKFKDLYIKDIETAKPGDLLCNGADMFFQLLEESTNTVQYVNVMKYILYRYSGIDYGVTDFEQLLDMFNTSSLSSSSSTNLVEYIFNYINNFEGTTGEEGEYYIAKDLGDGMITIGHGMTNAIPELSYIQHGTKVLKTEVDELEKDLIRDNIEWAKREIPNITNYQLVGIVSFMYNGPSSSTKMFQNYRTYWNEERDNKYFEGITTADIPNLSEQKQLISSRSASASDAGSAKNEEILTKLKAYINTPLYNEFWGGYCHGTYNGKRITYGGLLWRKWGEFLMFQYGYNCHDDSFYQFSGGIENWDGDVYVSVNYTFPVYLQKDSRWSGLQYGKYPGKTIGSSGCGCCSMSAILSGYTGEAVTPDKLLDVLNRLYPAKQYYDYGVGSNYLVWSNDVAKEFGCSVAGAGSRANALNALKNGYCVVGGEDGHVLAFVPVSSEDAAQGYVFRIIDSARGHNVLCRNFGDADSVVKGSAGVKVIVYPPGH